MPKSGDDTLDDFTQVKGTATPNDDDPNDDPKNAITEVDLAPVSVAFGDATLTLPKTKTPSAVARANVDQRFVQRSLLGEGGMGKVHLLSDTLVGRDIAMKVMHPSFGGTDELRKRFLREARVQGQLEHPSVVPVYDIGQDENGALYFMMKRVRGATLEDIVEDVRRGRRETKAEYTRHKLLTAFVRVCLAMDYAHERGVVHRDLKPSNVMLGRFGEVYVLDWGLAKLRGEHPVPTNRADGKKQEAGAGAVAVDPTVVGEAGDDLRTKAGHTLGTPAYMAPEQASGQSDLIDQKTDVYALGAILFEMLMLEPLHRGGDSEAVLRMARNAEHDVERRMNSAEIPPELVSICARATSRSRESRYGSARELGDGVEGFLNGDRDLELRSKLAHEHVAAALAAMNDNEQPGGEETTNDNRAHARALNELGRAVALTPDDRETQQLLTSVLVKRPSRIPAEVEAALESSFEAQHRVVLPWTAALYAGLSIITMLVFVLVLGMTNVLWLSITGGVWLVASGVLYVAHRLGHGNRFPYPLLLTTLAIVSTSALSGPWTGPVVIVAIHCLGFVFTIRKKHWWLVVASVSLCVLLPALLSRLELLPTHIIFDGSNRYCVESSIIGGFTRDAMYATVAFLDIAIVLAGVRFAMRIVDKLRDAERETHFLTWQLEQLSARRTPAKRS